MVRHMREKPKPIGEGRQNSVQLLAMISCSMLYHVCEADVNWYTGGNSYVSLPKSELSGGPGPGVYLAKTKILNKAAVADPDFGPDAIAAEITNLRYLGTIDEFRKHTMESKAELGQRKYERLMEMLTAGMWSDETTSNHDTEEE